MNVAAKERKSKERWPEDYCPESRCLWRTRTREGFKLCPKHQQTLTQTELTAIAAKVADDTADELDAGALLDHVRGSLA